jgi:putative phosphoribosyl transferase
LTSINAARAGDAFNACEAGMVAMTHRILPVRLPPYDQEGLLTMPRTPARGIVLFAHGSGSSRFSPRNTFVAQALQEAGLATLLFDLLSEREAANRANVFDIPLLADHLGQAASWLGTLAAGQTLPIGFFGASTGAAAALVAAATRPVSALSSAAAGDPIWPARRWKQSRRRRC